MTQTDVVEDQLIESIENQGNVNINININREHNNMNINMDPFSEWMNHNHSREVASPQ